MLNLDSKIEDLKIFNKPQIAALKKLGITNVQSLLLYFPRRHLDFSQTKAIRDLKTDESVTLKVTVKEINKRFSFRSRMSMAEAVVSDDTGSLRIVWFNQGYVADQLEKGQEVFLSGTPEYYKNSLQLTNPIYEKVSDFPLHTARLVPLYPRLPSSVYPKTFRRAIGAALPLAKEISDDLPKEIISRQKLLTLPETIKASHFPEKDEDIAHARKRLAFEEIFINQLAAQKYKLSLAKKQSYAVKFDQELVKNFITILPFELTAGQKKAAWEILQDLEKNTPMNRLLEADVGSGKTLVALIAALQACTQGLQAVLLAPTEILARQHFETARKYIKDSKVALLTNHYAKLGNADEDKKKLQAIIKAGLPGLFVGTHALIANKIKFKKLALAVIDEQHRFGVEQRAALLEHGKKVPHLLSLTATPIPRTLQLAVFGELEISTIKSKPLGRKPILTKLIKNAEREKAYKFLRDEINKGRQAFVITPLIEENDGLGVKAAKVEVENLRKLFPEFHVGLMHGRLKGTEKEQVMADFLDNRLQILVSTSVVEVGVDVPNASVMLIEGAERFGLAQLHQFRGRVGRARHQSYCMLFSENENPETINRLEEFTKTQDGFALAELDLKQRGFGDIYGQQQSGWNFKYFSPAYTSLIQPAREEALNILKQDFNLDGFPALKEQIKDKVVHFE